MLAGQLYHGMLVDLPTSGGEGVSGAGDHRQMGEADPPGFDRGDALRQLDQALAHVDAVGNRAVVHLAVVADPVVRVGRAPLLVFVGGDEASGRLRELEVEAIDQLAQVDQLDGEIGGRTSFLGPGDEAVDGCGQLVERRGQGDGSLFRSHSTYYTKHMFEGEPGTCLN